MLDAGWPAQAKSWCCSRGGSPARASAGAIAAERGGRLGEEIGYQVRFESRVSSRTRLAVITEGILLRRLLDDPFLTDVVGGRVRRISRAIAGE